MLPFRMVQEFTVPPGTAWLVEGPDAMRWLTINTQKPLREPLWHKAVEAGAVATASDRFGSVSDTFVRDCAATGDLVDSRVERSCTVHGVWRRAVGRVGCLRGRADTRS